MSFYDEIELEDLTYHPATQLYTYPCPCGDQFEISLADMRDGEEVAVCPSCSLQVRVIFDMVSPDFEFENWMWRSSGGQEWGAGVGMGKRETKRAKAEIG